MKILILALVVALVTGQSFTPTVNQEEGEVFSDHRSFQNRNSFTSKISVHSDANEDLRDQEFYFDSTGIDPDPRSSPLSSVKSGDGNSLFVHKTLSGGRGGFRSEEFSEEGFQLGSIQSSESQDGSFIRTEYQVTTRPSSSADLSANIPNDGGFHFESLTDTESHSALGRDSAFFFGPGINSGYQADPLHSGFSDPARGSEPRTIISELVVDNEKVVPLTSPKGGEFHSRFGSHNVYDVQNDNAFQFDPRLKEFGFSSTDNIGAEIHIPSDSSSPGNADASNILSVNDGTHFDSQNNAGFLSDIVVDSGFFTDFTPITSEHPVETESGNIEGFQNAFQPKIHLDSSLDNDASHSFKNDREFITGSVKSDEFAPATEVLQSHISSDTDGIQTGLKNTDSVVSEFQSLFGLNERRLDSSNNGFQIDSSNSKASTSSSPGISEFHSTTTTAAPETDFRASDLKVDFNSGVQFTTSNTGFQDRSTTSEQQPNSNGDKSQEIPVTDTPQINLASGDRENIRFMDDSGREKEQPVLEIEPELKDRLQPVTEPIENQTNRAQSTLGVKTFQSRTEDGRKNTGTSTFQSGFGNTRPRLRNRFTSIAGGSTLKTNDRSSAFSDNRSRLGTRFPPIAGGSRLKTSDKSHSRTSGSHFVTGSRSSSSTGSRVQSGSSGRFQVGSGGRLQSGSRSSSQVGPSNNPQVFSQRRLQSGTGIRSPVGTKSGSLSFSQSGFRSGFPVATTSSPRSGSGTRLQSKSTSRFQLGTGRGTSSGRFQSGSRNSRVQSSSRNSFQVGTESTADRGFRHHSGSTSTSRNRLQSTSGIQGIRDNSRFLSASGRPEIQSNSRISGFPFTTERRESRIGNTRFHSGKTSPQTLSSRRRTDPTSSGARPANRQNTESTKPSDGVFEPLNLPAEATNLLGRISTSFSCQDRPYGYYADSDNSCKVFHVCYPARFASGTIEVTQYSFLCSEGSVFDQRTLACMAETTAIPCQESSNYFYTNEQFGLPIDRFN